MSSSVVSLETMKPGLKNVTIPLKSKECTIGSAYLRNENIIISSTSKSTCKLLLFEKTL